MKVKCFDFQLGYSNNAKTMMIEYVALACLILAVLHTFLAPHFLHWSHKYKEGTPLNEVFHLLSEVELVFGIWATIFLIGMAILGGNSIQYLDQQNFTEPFFVFVIMVICSSKPILDGANRILTFISNGLPFSEGVSFFLVSLILGPLLGSFITEPAAMTVVALLLAEKYFTQVSERLKYAIIGLLFVNISIGGSLTPYAAPPVLMVAQKFNYDLVFMVTHFGYKSILAIISSSILVLFVFVKELREVKFKVTHKDPAPLWVQWVHLFFVVAVVMSAHHMKVFVGLFLLFLGFTKVTRIYQSSLKIREGLLVGFFLAGLVVLGGYQRWWLEPILTTLQSFSLYLGTTVLTAFTDNAALTYLGSLVPDLSDNSKWSLVAGALVGGGLSVIANAPNPAGYGILTPHFEEGIGHGKLFLAALGPTVVAFLFFWFLP